MRKKQRISIKNLLSLTVCFSIVFSLMSSLWVQPVEAATVRVAQIEEVTGTVNIKKAGGSKAFRAYPGMTLHQGDHISTEEFSSVIFKVVDSEDEITIDERADLYISDLRDESGNKKTRFTMWSGSMWAKVSSLVSSEDEFEIETPTTVMGVRGTNLLVGVDPETGESTFYIASGIGSVSKKSDGQSSGTTLNPNEMISIDEDTSSDNLDDYKNIADLNDLITNTSNAIIEAIIANKAAIDQENEEYIAKLQEEQDETGGTSQEAIDRINQNLQNLVGNIVKNAISQNKVDEVAIKAFIENINQQLDKKLDLNNVKAQELSDQEKAKQAQIKLLEEERKKKQEAEKQKQEERKKQNEELQKKLKEQLEKQKAEKQKAAEAAKKKAAEEYAKKLQGEAARLAFEAKQKELAALKQKQDAAATATKAAAETLRTVPVPESEKETSSPSPGGGSNNPTPSPDITVTAEVYIINDYTQLRIEFNRQVKDLEADDIFIYEDEDETKQPLTVTKVIDVSSEDSGWRYELAGWGAFDYTKTYTLSIEKDGYKFKVNDEWEFDY